MNEIFWWANQWNGSDAKPGRKPGLKNDEGGLLSEGDLLDVGYHLHRTNTNFTERTPP